MEDPPFCKYNLVGKETDVTRRCEGCGMTLSSDPWPIHASPQQPWHFDGMDFCRGCAGAYVRRERVPFKAA